ncbi:hypothetical protein [Legionella tunisiensis]|uniref:hypothetical protein n=1 Tax=Legionella tunisiensis TaxID=1034944 RepID=UPI0002F850E2|nr:hypothetical protein [Legionella tunisiensis]
MEIIKESKLKQKWENCREEYLTIRPTQAIQYCFTLAQDLSITNPLDYLMPGVYFKDKHYSSDGLSWVEMFLSGDLFIPLDFFDTDTGKMQALSVKDIFYNNKQNGSLSGEFFYSCLGETMSDNDFQRYLAKLEALYPELYQEYLDDNNHAIHIDDVREELHDSKYDGIFNTMIMMLYLSMFAEGEKKSFLADDLRNELPTFAYTFLE